MEADTQLQTKEIRKTINGSKHMAAFQLIVVVMTKTKENWETTYMKANTQLILQS